MLVQAGQVKSAAPMQHGLSGDSVRVTEGSGHLSRIHQANAAMPSEVLGGVHWASHGRFHRGLVAGVILFAHADLSSAMKRDNPQRMLNSTAPSGFSLNGSRKRLLRRPGGPGSPCWGLLCVARLGPLGGKRQLGEALSCTANPDRADHR
jgi:hypothetical protein